MKKNILDEETFKEICSRIRSITAENKRRWGTMSVDEMLCHCKQPLKNALSIIDAELEVSELKSMVFRFGVVHVIKRLPKGAPTGKAYDMKKGKVSVANLENERKELLSLLQQFFNYPRNRSYGMHPLFGNMNNKEWGISTYMHLDHHLRQFYA